MSGQILSITLIQTDIHWQDAPRNRNALAEKITNTPPSDLILLPEMFSTGFSMQSKELAEDMDGPTVNWMRRMAESTGAVICGTLIIREAGKFYNRLLWVLPDGAVQFYDKHHLFRMAGEDTAYSAGQGRLLVDLNGWRLLPLVCYDLRFPLWSRNKPGYYDVLLYLANWPLRRISHWDTLLAARAIENQSYCIGLNRTGQDGDGIRYPGHSAVYDFAGQPLVQLEDNETIRRVALDRSSLELYRQKFPVWKDADRFDLSAK